MRPKLPALEKNILQYRALQMILLLHEVETFREFLVGSIRATDRITGQSKKDRIPENTRDPMGKALSVLVEEGIITQQERENIHGIILQRNHVSHRIHKLLTDISAPDMRLGRDPTYDYLALDRFEQHRKKIVTGMQGLFVLSIGFRELSFEPAEAAYKEELGRLRRRIDRLCEERIVALRKRFTPTPEQLAGIP